MSVVIRNFKENDIGQALELCNEIREYHRELLNGYFKPLNREFEEDALLSTLKDENDFVMVAVEGDKLVGLLIATKKNTPYLEKSPIVHIGTLGVVREYRGKGIGKMLMNECVKFCRENGIDEIDLSVYNANKNAVKFYEDCSFESFRQTMCLKLDEK